MVSTVSVIIPCYNEEERILPLVSALKASKIKKEIIVVNDGSNEKTKNILQKIKGIKLLNHPQNFGKSQTIKTGLLNSSSEIVVFIDADLKGFKPHHLKQMIAPLTNQDFDMVVANLEIFSPIFKLSGYSCAYSGQRAFHRSLLIENLDIFDNQGYFGGFLLEAKMNQRFLKTKKITKVCLEGVGQSYKISKFGLKYFFKDIKIMAKIGHFLGPKEHLYQINFFRRLQPYCFVS